MHTDPLIAPMVGAIFLILMLAILMKWLKQSHVVVYLLAGMLLGPNVFNLVSDHDTLTRIGSFGIILLLFFVGMEVSPRKLVDNWLVAVVGTLLQVLLSVLVVALIGLYFLWPIGKIVLFGFVISLSSTAVVMKLLGDWREVNSRVGQNVIGILLVQDLVVVPMLIILGIFGGQGFDSKVVTLQVIGGLFLVSVVAYLLMHERLQLPWIKLLGADHEMQVFAALGICFGMSLLSGLTQLSAPLGAFIGGMIVSSAKETHWVHQSLSSIRVIFIALFFVSIGMILDLDYLFQNKGQILSVLFAVYLTNTFVNAAILRFLGENWAVALYGGGLLSQVGEFSFLLAAVGLQLKLISMPGYQLIISTIALSLLLSPVWIRIIKRITKLTALPAGGR